MKIQDILQKNHVVIDVKTKDKTDLITQLGRYLVACHNLPNPDGIVQKILEREAEMSTGIGFGIAIPHSRIDGLARPCMVAARSAEDIEFDAIDEQPVRLVFILLTSTNTATEHTELLTRLSKIMADETNRRDLLAAPTAGEFLSVMIRGENGLDK